MNLPIRARDEQRYMVATMKMVVNAMWLKHINGAITLGLGVTNIMTGTWYGIVIGIILLLLVKSVSDALTNHQSDLARLRFMYEQMKDGLYLQEALNEFDPEVREYMKNKYIHNDIIS